MSGSLESKISIIMPSLNQGAYISQAIESVLNQDYPEIELIIIDGGSSDDTVEIIKQYERDITYWVSEKDAGQSDAINKGLKIATGEVVNWLNSDDYYLPAALRSVADAFSESDILCVCAVTRIAGAGREREKRTYVNKADLADTLRHLLIEQSSTFFKKQVFDSLNGVSPDLHYVMDRDVWIKFLIHYGMEPVKVIDDVIVNFRHHKDSKTVCLQDQFAAEYASLLHSFSTNPALNALLVDMFEDSRKSISSRGDKFQISPEYIDQMIIGFLLKRARDLSRQNDMGLGNKILGAVNISDYKLGQKEWKWFRQFSCASLGNLHGFFTYINTRYW